VPVSETGVSGLERPLIIVTPAAMSEWSMAQHRAGRRIGLVPTMGALHLGHVALIARAQADTDVSVVSIFVNPLQFDRADDFDRYPRPLDADVAVCRDLGVDVVYAPLASAMYGPGFRTKVAVGELTATMEGAARPGHFDGVATVVAKLFNQVRPDVALFGEKDYQQLAVIRRMTADLDLGVEIVGLPTQRDRDGLALSSRNAYLSADQRAAAAALPSALADAARTIASGGDPAVALGEVHARLEAAGFATEYVELRDADSLAPVERLERPARLLAAARLGTTRLIDNMAIHPNRDS
jgi:pantoate--beta-alanine ligase